MSDWIAKRVACLFLSFHDATARQKFSGAISSARRAQWQPQLESQHSKSSALGTRPSSKVLWKYWFTMSCNRPISFCASTNEVETVLFMNVSRSDA